MYNYGIRGNVLKWFESYLSNRKQYVSIDNYNSQFQYINVGVPQGSVLGPLLFLLYVNDLVFVSNILKPIIFADDTNIFLSGKNIHDMNIVFNTELEKVHLWFITNKLTIN